MKTPGKNLKVICEVLLVLNLSGCAHIAIKDAEWCGDAGPLGASCFNTLSSGSRDLSKPEWDAARVGMVCTVPDSFSNWKAAILKFCSQTKICTFEFKKKLNEFVDKTETFEK